MGRILVGRSFDDGLLQHERYYGGQITTISYEKDDKHIFISRELLQSAKDKIYPFSVYYCNNTNWDSVSRHFKDLMSALVFFRKTIKTEFDNGEQPNDLETAL